MRILVAKRRKEGVKKAEEEEFGTEKKRGH